ncbi:type III secretion protein C [Pelomonas saccharophila]|uniref:Type 3 secretion system secretin n=1 Tax=Roseateles saccharophilus TaxID=304 RepID=A0ABU1YIU0_ROSSA|nr:type III secretion system outer membrane ring subunit SctC [Roseateles saccharophilus]MDR7267956.1 type III secretion protein C [Roseateles saccharophilus]
MLRSAYLLFCAGLVAALLASPATAADLPRNGRPFRMEANEKPVGDFLRELAASQGVTAVIDGKVSGTISGRFAITGSQPGAVQMVLSNICAANGLTWYYDGAFLFIDPAADTRSEVFTIAGKNAPRIADTLARLKIADARYPLQISEADGNVYVSGPKRYVELVRQTVRLIDQRAARDDRADVQVFPLRYAWAADFKINRAGKQVSIPGVATVLRNLYGRSGAGRASAPSSVTGPVRRTKLGVSDGAGSGVAKLSSEGSSAAEDEGDAGGTEFASGELPQFQPDTRLNAVLVRDTPERMARYEKLIQTMDVRPRLIEIEVTIMDISTNTLDSLGVDWRLHARHGDLQIGRGNLPPLTFGNANSEAGQVVTVNPQGNPSTPLGALFTASIGNDLRNYLLTRVSALAQKGNANFIARPKVLTLDNNEAVLENLSEFYVRVDGFQDSSLYSVTAGTAVRVTPLIVDDKEGRGVLMSIDIEDGDVSSSMVDRIPVVRRRTVNTQALVDEGASLLIAGYTSEEKANATSGVPLLSSIPVLGKLFQYSEKKQNNMERFYLLTPRLVTSGSKPPLQQEPTQ